jgi:hypothetical protein
MYASTDCAHATELGDRPSSGVVEAEVADGAEARAGGAAEGGVHPGDLGGGAGPQALDGPRCKELSLHLRRGLGQAVLEVVPAHAGVDENGHGAEPE